MDFTQTLANALSLSLVLHNLNNRVNFNAFRNASCVRRRNLVFRARPSDTQIITQEIGSGWYGCSGESEKICEEVRGAGRGGVHVIKE
jgi:hypothetical protein